MNTNPTSVLFAQLVPGDDVNARGKADRMEGISELAALIAHKGLIQPLSVRAMEDGRFKVSAGNRRLAAIAMLIKDGRWPAGQHVDVKVRDESDRDARETSLIENIGRRAMHPIDEFEVFAALHDNGKGANVEAIAEQNGTTVQAVRQRLALGALSPLIRKAWRDGEINGDTARAFAVCRDVKQQADAFASLKRRGLLYEHNVRGHFVKDRPKITDPRVAFVGLDVYKAAGGKVVGSLFADDGFLEDSKLLDRLTEQALQKKCEALIADGWSWAIPSSELVGHSHHSWARESPKRKFTSDEKARSAVINKRLDALRGIDEQDADEDAEYERLEAEASAIEVAALERGFSKTQKERAGCIVSVSRSEVQISYGLIRGKTQAQVDRAKAKQKAEASGEPVEKPDAGISQALTHDVTALRTQAARAALATVPDVAIRFVAAALVSGGGDGVCLRVNGYQGTDRFGGSGDDDVEFADALADLSTPEKAAAVLAVRLGAALNLVSWNSNSLPDANHDALVAALPGKAFLDEVLKLFSPEDYFGRASGAIALAALNQMERYPPNASSLKAADAKKLAIAAARETGWLPAELRHPDYALAGAVPAKRRRAA